MVCCDLLVGNITQKYLLIWGLREIPTDVVAAPSMIYVQIAGERPVSKHCRYMLKQSDSPVAFADSRVGASHTVAFAVACYFQIVAR